MILLLIAAILIVDVPPLADVDSWPADLQAAYHALDSDPLKSFDMNEAKTRKFCKQCQSNVLAVRPVPNHILHFLITICTCGLWVIPWLLFSFQIGGWKCPNCGRGV